MAEYTIISLKRRLVATTVAIAFVLFLISVKLFYVQIIQGETLQSKAIEQWMRELPLSALRGTITDRNGVVLASSYTTYDIYVRPSNVASAEQVATLLSETLEIDYSKVFEKVSDKTQSETLIKKEVVKEKATIITKNHLEGIYLSENTSRYYEFGDLLSQVIGFVGADGDGQAGLEAFYNTYLKGIKGFALTETDTAGKELELSSGTYIPSIQGLSIQLTIDYEFQLLCEKVMSNVQSMYNAKSSTAIVINPNTGELLALAISPTFDLNKIPRENVSELLSLSRNVAVCDSYEPGSTFKILTAAIALNEGLTSPSDGFYCPGFRIINGVKINCHRRTGHGSQTLAQGLMNSCNCVFMDLVQRIGLEKFYTYMQKFSLGTGTGIDFPSESKGIMMSKGLVTASDLARMGFGQSIALTPLQLINSVAAVINGGSLMRPFFVSKITSASGETSYIQKATKITQIVSSSVSKTMNNMLEQVVKSGGGKKAFIPGYKVAGKTGTAQKYKNGVIAEGKYVASFLGYAPADDPKYLVLVVVDEPQGGFYGSTVAAPAAKQILEGIFKITGFQPTGDEEADNKLVEKNIQMPNLLGKSLTEAASLLVSLGLFYEVEGTGGVVTAQVAGAGSFVCEGDVVLIRMSEE